MPPVELVELRKQAGRSQTEVAAALGFHVATINRHERAKTPLSRVHRIAYATYYGVDPDTIEQPERAAA